MLYKHGVRLQLGLCAHVLHPQINKFLLQLFNSLLVVGLDLAQAAEVFLPLDFVQTLAIRDRFRVILTRHEAYAVFVLDLIRVGRA
jgi:hypothetical protein